MTMVHNATTTAKPPWSCSVSRKKGWSLPLIFVHWQVHWTTPKSEKERQRCEVNRKRPVHWNSKGTSHAETLGLQNAWGWRFQTALLGHDSQRDASSTSRAAQLRGIRNEPLPLLVTQPGSGISPGNPRGRNLIPVPWFQAYLHGFETATSCYGEDLPWRLKVVVRHDYSNWRNQSPTRYDLREKNVLSWLGFGEPFRNISCPAFECPHALPEYE